VDLGGGEAFGEFGLEPFGGFGVAVDEEEVFGVGFFGEVGEFVASGVSGEVEFFDLAVEGDAVAAIKFDEIAGVGGKDEAGGGDGIGVADHEEGVFGVLEEISGEGVGDGFF